MVALTEIRRSNASLKARAPITAVFVGATAGIGFSTLTQLAIHGNAPKVYIVGRSLSSFSAKLDTLKSLNPEATFIFIEAQVSLLKDIDRVCDEIRSEEQKIDLLWLSMGALSLNGRQDTSEGLALNLALTFYARMRAIYDLLPQLSQSPTGGRVVSILAAGMEGAMVTSDLDLKSNYSLPNTTTHGATMNALALEELASQNPRISFVYAYPGFVNTDLIGKLLGGVEGWLGYVTKVLSWVVSPILTLVSKSEEEAGERGLYEATSSTFAVGAEGSESSSFYRINGTQDKAAKVEVLEKYRADGMTKKVWEHTMGVFETALT